MFCIIVGLCLGKVKEKLEFWRKGEVDEGEEREGGRAEGKGERGILEFVKGNT